MSNKQIYSKHYFYFMKSLETVATTNMRSKLTLFHNHVW